MSKFDEILKKADDERLARSINNYINRFRPGWNDFEDVYSGEEINEDKNRLRGYFTRKGVNIANKRNELRDGILLEKLFLDADQNNLFDEEGMYDELMTGDEDYLLFTMPAHEYDDVFNNADIICLVRNEYTGHKTVPFVVDCTSNALRVGDKMGYKKTEEKIEGFTELKYYYDKISGIEGIPAGRLEKIPRFVVGFDAGLARELINTNDNEWTKEELEQKRDRARYYLLKELAAQAKYYDNDLKLYFSKLLEHFEKTRGIDVEAYPADDVVLAVVSKCEKKSEVA